MGHQRSARQTATPHEPRTTTLDDATARSVAVILQGLATPSRLRILTALQAGPMSVGEIIDAVAMEQSAVSHQLKHLRDLGFITAERQGRQMIYRLYDSHVLDLIDEGLAHAEHLKMGRVDTAP